MLCFSRGFSEESGNKVDLVRDPDPAVLELSLAHCAEALDARESGFGTGQGVKPAHGAQSPLQRGMVAFDPVVEKLAIIMTDRVVWPRLSVIAPMTLA